MKNLIIKCFFVLCVVSLFGACTTCKYGCPAKITDNEIKVPTHLPAIKTITEEVAD